MSAALFKISKAHLKHREIFDEIKRKIDSGVWLQNRVIPTERELSDYYYCSRTTIRKAIERLKQRGYLHSVHGKGTFVLPARCRENRLLHSFTDDIKNKGGKPEQKILEIGPVAVNDVIRKSLGLDDNTQTVFFVKRIRYSCNTPMGTQSSWLILKEDSFFSAENLIEIGSLYQLLEEKYGIKPLEAIETISARLPSPGERSLLELSVDDAVLSCTRITLTVNRVPLEYVEMVYPGSRYTYNSRITKDSFAG